MHLSRKHSSMLCPEDIRCLMYPEDIRCSLLRRLFGKIYIDDFTTHT